MIVSISDQAALFLLTVGTGILIGFIYDLFRILRKTFPHPDIITHMEDLLYWVFVSFMMFYILLYKNYGEIRGFAIFGSFLGMGLYFLTLSPIFMKITLTIIGWIKKLLCFLWHMILIPVRFIRKMLSYPYAAFKKIWGIGKRKAGSMTRRGGRYIKKQGRQLAKEIHIITKKI